MKNRKSTSFISMLLHDYVMLFVLIALIVLGGLCSDVFLSQRNIMNLFKQMAVIGILALGVSFVIIGGSFDMSVGSTISLVGVVTIILQKNEVMPAIPAMLVGILVGAIVGVINGSLMALINGDSGDSFIITFGMLTFVQSVALVITGGYNYPGSGSVVFDFLGKATIGKMPVSFLVFIALAIICYIVLSKTKFGRKLYYIGSSAEVAKYSGIRVNRYRIIIYAISGVLAAIAAIVLTGRVNGATPKAGLNYEFDAVTAIVVGGVGLNGGKGNIIHTVIGVIIMSVLSNLLNLIGIHAEGQYVVKGIVLIMAVLMDVLRTRLNAREVAK